MAQLTDLTELINVINAVQGKGETTTTSGGTTTERTQTQVSDQGVNQIIQNILAGRGGVRSIGNSARSAGMYDSTTEDMMMGDLYARAANQAELARSPTVRSTTVPKQTTMTAMPGMDPMSLALTLGGTSAMSSLMKGEMPFKGTYDAISGMFGGGGGGAGAGGGITDAISGIFGGGAGSGAAVPGGFMSQIGRTGLGVSGGVSNTAISAANSVAGGASSAGGSSMLSNLGSAGNIASGVGGLLSGFSQEEEVLDSGGKLLATLGPAAAVGGPMGAAVAGLGAILGSGLSGGSIQDTIAGIPIVGDVLDPIIGGVRSIGRSIGDAVGTIICTALAERGLINKRQYRRTLSHMRNVSQETLKGYHYWATPIARKISEGHKGWTAFWLPLVKGRVALLSSRQTFLDHIKHPLGTVTKLGIEPTCTLIGKYLTWKESKEVKAQGAY